MNKLYSICWNIESECNEHCKFCYRKHCKNNTLNENKKIFDNISQLEIDKITLCGGEPLLYKPLFELIHYMKEKRPSIKLSITTNGMLVDNQMLEKIVDNFDNISFSIDSSDAKINESIGRGILHLSKVLSLLEKCNNRIKIKINTVANQMNKEDLNNIYRLISKYNIDRWKIFRFYPIRTGKDYKDMFFLNDVESQEIEKFIEKLNRTSKIKIHYNDFTEFTTSYFNIYPDGSLENSKEENIGNLLYQNVFDILELYKEELQNHYLRKN